jgi:hypothetical protein
VELEYTGKFDDPQVIQAEAKFELWDILKDKDTVEKSCCSVKKEEEK